LLADDVHAAVDVRVVGAVVALERVEHGDRLLRGRRRVEIDERMPVDLPVEDRELLADGREVDRRQGLHAPIAAFRSTASVTIARSDSAGIRSSTGSKKPWRMSRSASC